MGLNERLLLPPNTRALVTTMFPNYQKRYHDVYILDFVIFSHFLGTTFTWVFWVRVGERMGHRCLLIIEVTQKKAVEAQSTRLFDLEIIPGKKGYHDVYIYGLGQIFEIFLHFLVTGILDCRNRATMHWYLSARPQGSVGAQFNQLPTVLDLTYFRQK